MSHTNRNFVIAYVLLVLVPLVALAGILRVGHSIKAPISVDGTWNLHLDSAQLGSLPCGKTLAATPEKALVVSQSGESFVLSFANGPRVASFGTLDGAILRASLNPSATWAEETGCGAGRRLSLVATINPSSKPRSMAGKLSVDDCPSCSPAEFYAFQQAAPPSKGGH